ncbi:PaaI family thioesterase [Roseovarius autotrophicus]|uniref:PaaI family thioesterase n=1 Tax=Roseovarius autotrophicus TaxID=2824121 RepID=UPI001A093028|nr:PaaI family thioesterase [Roseovarius autotrophicus]MBE0452619.1 PaaI family thioesterase [Roseovarius sp.]
MGHAGTVSTGVEARIRESFAAQGMMATLGARLAHIGPGLVRIEAPILPGSRQQHGFAHAGLTFSIGDSAAGYAALSVMPEGHEVLTSEMKIHLLAPAKGDLLVATGRVIRAGRRLVIVQADVHAHAHGRQSHVALLTGTMIPLAP